METFLKNENKGTILLHTRKVSSRITADSKNLMFILRTEEQNGINYIKTQVPGAVYRAHCRCCYGNGPDIMIDTIYNNDNSLDINFYVDFDFEKD